MDFLNRLRLSVLAAFLLAAPAVLAPLHGAMAQSQGSSDDDRDAADAQAAAEAKAAAKAAAPPAAIPGAVTDEATATSGHMSADMEPTAALFDAINRGDMTSAKEALGRGADLNGRNVLGQSPLDMSIDLNRNDITFLLLSMRNGEAGTPAASVASAEPATVTAEPAAGGRKSRRSRGTRLAAAREEVAGGRRLTPVADSGTPRPDVGFLGFGGT